MTVTYPCNMCGRRYAGWTELDLIYCR